MKPAASPHRPPPGFARRLRWRIACLCIALVCPRGWSADGARTVLKLDGTSAAVRLPTEVFSRLREATVEGWVRYDSLGTYSRFWEVGIPSASLNVTQVRRAPDLAFEGWFGRGPDHASSINLAGILRTNEWIHVAAVCGRRGMKLYVNGELVGANETRASFSRLRAGPPGPPRRGSAPRPDAPGNDWMDDDLLYEPPTAINRGSRGFQPPPGADIHSVESNGMRVTWWTNQGPGGFWANANATLGRSVGNGFETPLVGAVSEFRVWKRERTGDEIRQAMFARLHGDEPGLAALWPLAGDGRNRASPGSHDLSIPESAFSDEPFPAAGQMAAPAILSGAVTDGAGRPLDRVHIRVTAGGRLIAATRTGGVGEAPTAGHGAYSIAIYATGQPLEATALWPGGASPPFSLALKPREIHHWNVRLPMSARSAETTNAFLNTLVADLELPDAAFRDQAVRELADYAGAPIAAAGLGRILQPETPLDLQLRAAENLGEAARQSPAAQRAVLEAAGRPLPNAVRVQLAKGLRQMPVPDWLEPFYAKRSLAAAMLLAGILGALTVLHFLLFVFHPPAVSNIYYALLTGLATIAAVLTGSPGAWATGPYALMLYLAIFVSGLRLLYAHFSPRLPVQFWAAAAYLAAMAAAAFAFDKTTLRESSRFLILCGALYLSVIAEMVRVLFVAVVNGRRGSLTVGAGFALFVLCQLSVPLAAWEPVRNLLGEAISANLYQIGMAGFVIANSVHLAREFAYTQRRLLDANHEIEAKNSELEAAFQTAEAARQQASEANLAKSAFLASVSHELRTPLNAIIGYSEMLEEEAPEIGADSMTPDLKRIQSAARHQLGLVNDILDLSKIEAGRMSVHVSVFSPEEILRDMVQTVRPLAAKNNNTLEIEIPGALPPMGTDQTKLRQILLNLLSNALKFTRDGMVRLSARVDADAIVFEVADTGIGMSPAQMARLFQPFTQAETTTHSKYGGTGLGLALCRKYAEMLGGSIHVASEPARGSTFTVTLPLSTRPGGTIAMANPAAFTR